MTINELQICLVKQVEEIVKGIPLSGAGRGSKVMKGYVQSVPVRDQLVGWEEAGEEEPYVSPEDSLMPYFVVRVSDAEYFSDRATVRVYLLFSIYNDDKDMKGHFDLLNVLERVTGQFRQNQIMDGYWCEKEMKAAVQDDDDYPYFFGGVEMTWNMPVIEMEEYA